MATINFRNKKLYSSRTDRPGWFDNIHGWTRENGLDEFKSFKNTYIPQSNTKILLKNQYFISTRLHSGYGHRFIAQTFGRSDINSYAKYDDISQSFGVNMAVYKDAELYSDATHGGFSPKKNNGYGYYDTDFSGTANVKFIKRKGINNKNMGNCLDFIIYKVDYDRF